MRALITGGAGLLGQALIRAVPPGVEVHATSRRTPAAGCPEHRVDLADEPAVAALFEAVRPRLVLHTAYSADDGERDIWRATGAVLEASLRAGAALVHVSTDMVFDGEGAPYAEDREPAPVLEYGRWKARAEALVRRRDPGAAVVRASLLMSFDPPDPRTAWVLAGLRGGAEVGLYVDEVRTPIAVDDLAAQIWEIAALPAAERAGVWHLAGPEALSRYALGALIAARFGESAARIVPRRSAESPVPRPRDLRLGTARADAVLRTRARGPSGLLVPPTPQDDPMPGPPRVRFAPSPTGYLHVGGARTALFNWLFARGQGGVFVLRIEDTDRERSSDEMSAAILDGMRWLGLDWDEGPFHQADGFDRHRADVRRLVESGKAYPCFCSPEALQAKREAAGDEYRYDRACAGIPAFEAARRAEAGEPHTVRFRVPAGVTAWDDLVHGETAFRNEDLDDFIVLRTDGTPIYNLAVVSDDVEMRISHVVRGDDHLSNTPKQILLYEALGAPVPVFAHLPMILGADGKRLSKRHGATAVGEFRDRGILPQALVNFLALLGWNPGDEQEVMDPAELVARFGLDRVNRKSAVFDPEKLAWMNGQHLMRAPASELLPLVAPALVAAGLTTDQEIQDRRDWFHDLLDLLKPRARYLDGIVEQAAPFLAPTVEYERAGVEKHWKDPARAAATLEAVEAALAALPAWEPAAVEAALRDAADRLGLGFGKVVHPLRLALTGATASPGIDQVVALMGPDLVRARLEHARAALREAPRGENN